MSTESYPPSGLSASVQKLPEWIQKGCGDKEYICEEKGATFSADSPPADCPDLSKHNSFFSESMNADIWNKLKDKKTKLGVTLAHCIKTGVDNPGMKSRIFTFFTPSETRVFPESRFRPSDC